MPSTPKLSQPEMILIAFYKVAEGTTQRVPYEELVLQAWRDFPQAFSLRNHPEYPDASDIHKRIYSNLKTAGYVVSLRNKMFRLTEKGVMEAERLLSLIEGRQRSSDATGLRLARDEQRLFEHALHTDAFKVWQSGEQSKLVEYDARIFFQFSTGTGMEERKKKVSSVLEALNKAAKIGINGATELLGLANYLVQRYSHLLREE